MPWEQLLIDNKGLMGEGLRAQDHAEDRLVKFQKWYSELTGMYSVLARKVNVFGCSPLNEQKERWKFNFRVKTKEAFYGEIAC